MANNQKNEKKEIYLGRIQKGEENNVYWSMGGSVTIIDLIIDYNRVVENVRNSALMLRFLVAILGYLSEFDIGFFQIFGMINSK